MIGGKRAHKEEKGIQPIANRRSRGGRRGAWQLSYKRREGKIPEFRL